MDGLGEEALAFAAVIVDRNVAIGQDAKVGDAADDRVLAAAAGAGVEAGGEFERAFAERTDEGDHAPHSRSTRRNPRYQRAGDVNRFR